MKPQSYILVNQQVMRNALQHINSLECDGKLKVTISSSGSKSARRRNLQWMWYSEVVNSGIGGKHEESKESVHRFSKFKFAVPLLLRDDTDFADLWTNLHKLYRGDSEKMKYIVDNFVSTEGDDFAMGEYLTEFHRYYSDLGVNLSNPDDLGLIHE